MTFLFFISPQNEQHFWKERGTLIRKDIASFFDFSAGSETEKIFQNLLGSLYFLSSDFPPYFSH